MHLPPSFGFPARSLLRQCRSAFTLVEILLATALMTIVIMLVVQILGTVMGAWGRASTSLEQNSEAALILDTIGRDLTGAVVRTDGVQKWFRHTKVTLKGRSYANIVMLSTPVDRGRVVGGASNDNPALLPGNISTLAYSVLSVNPIKPTSNENLVNSVFRYMTKPENTYGGALSNFVSVNSESVRASMGPVAVADSKSLLASNIYGFDLSYAYRDKTNKLVIVPTESITTLEFPLVKNGAIIPAPEYFEITFTILSSAGAERLDAVRAGLTTEKEETIIAKESRQFSRRFYMPTKGLGLSSISSP